MGEITLDTSTNIVMPDMKDYYTTFYMKEELDTQYNSNLGAYVLIDSSDTGIANHVKFVTELNGAKRLETYSYMDNNCVVLVNDNWPVTNASKNSQDWVTTQRILDK